MSTIPAEIVGAYVFHQKLGEGGMGAVYLATNRLTGQKAALKKLHTNLLQEKVPEDTDRDTRPNAAIPGETTRIRTLLAREFQTMASLHHPNIVGVLDYGFDSLQMPYFTMELLDSPQTIVEAGEGRDVKFKVELLVQLLHALAYLHRRTILHRDIKPSNVLVVNNQVKLVDFGIAEAAGAAKDLAGTIHYMAPELFLGEPPSPATDLYAVGVVACELFIKRHPYSGRGGRTQLLEHLLGEQSDDTLAPGMDEMLAGFSEIASSGTDESDHASIEEALAQIDGDNAKLSFTIMKLLARSSAERYHNPLQVIHDLSEAIGQPLPVETAVTRDSFLQAAEFVGREAEIAQINDALNQADAGSGSVWIVSGESGVGKSRLSKELRVLALIRAACVVNNQGVTERVANYSLWNPVVRALCLDTPLDDSEVAILKDIAPDIEILLNRKVPAPPPLSPQAAQARLYSTVLSLLHKQSQLVVLILEDLHWAGSDSLDLLGYLSPRIGALRVMILGNHREDEATEELQSLTGVHRLRLERLGDTQISRLSESMLGDVGRRPEIVDYLKKHTEGNVFFLVETVRALAEMAGQLDRIDVHTLPEELLTGGIGRIVQHRLGQVPPQFATLLDIAAVAGRRLDMKVMAWVSGVQDLSPFLLSCAQASVLDFQQSYWQFTHDKIREWLNSHLSMADKRRLHGQVAEAITTLYPDDHSQDATLGYHWERANVLDKAYDYYVKAGGTAARLYAIGEARVHFSSALSILDRLDGSPDNSRGQADTLLQLLSISQHWSKLPELITRLPGVEKLMDALLAGEIVAQGDVVRRAQLTLWRGRYSSLYGFDIDRAIDHCEEVRALAKKHKLAAIEALALLMIAQCKGYQGHLGVCRSYLREVGPWIESKVGSIDWVRWASLQGLVLVCQGEVTQGFDYIRKAMQSAKDPQTLINTLALAASAHMTAQDWMGARDLAAKASAIAEQGGDKRALAVIHSGQCAVEAHLGNFEASDYYQQSYDAQFGKHQIMLWLDHRIVAFAEGLRVKGRLAEAIEVAQRAISIGASISGISGPGKAYRIWGQALARQASSDREKIASHFLRSIEMLTQGEVWLEVAHTQAAYADVLKDWGDIANAARYYALAIERYEAAQLPQAIVRARQQLSLISGTNQSHEVNFS